MPHSLLIIGCNGYVSAIDTRNGEEIWRTQLREGFFKSSRGSDVRVLIDDHQVFAGCGGRIYFLDTSNGAIAWSNELKGLGVNEVALARQGTHHSLLPALNKCTLLLLPAQAHTAEQCFIHSD